jgi:ATP-dependent RNA helicase RhlE
MYSKNTSAGTRTRSGSFAGGRPSFNRFSNSGARPQGRGFSRFSGNRSRGGFKKGRIDENLFVSKALPVEENTYVSKHTFLDFKIHPQLAKNIAEKEYIHPSAIQDQAIPVALTGADVIGIASTGTGKTAAFLIPLINKLVEDPKQKIMIMAPTRELAQQIEKEFRSFTKFMRLWSITCVGGAPIMRQIRELERGVHMVIGTPGRIKDLIDRAKIVPSQFNSVVLDEADRMLDMGFIDDMKFILKMMPAERQTLFFSATFSPEIKALCQQFLTNPVTVAIPSRATAANVEQDIVRVEHKSKKVDKLHDILIQPECSKVLVFCEMKRSVDQLKDELASRGFKALALHGDMRNRERERAVQALSSGDAHVVIATDVAARGIDIADISHVINFDTPSTYDTYIHRIGRTGRGSKQGKALTFV